MRLHISTLTHVEAYVKASLTTHLKGCFEIASENCSIIQMKISSIFKAELHTRIIAMYSTTCKRRPMKLDIDEGIDCLFRIVRTGMQWREIEVKSASISALFKHVHRWVKAGVIQDAYTSMLHSYASRNDEKYYIIDSSHVKNVYGRKGTGRSPVDRGRKGLKISTLVDCNGMVHNIRSDPANVSDFKLFTPMLTSMLINLRRIEVFADKGYDSRSNRKDGYDRGFLPRIMKRKCRGSRRQNGKRVRVEHAFAWIDNFRRLRVQYECTSTIHVAYTLLALGHVLCNRFFLKNE